MNDLELLNNIAVEHVAREAVRLTNEAASAAHAEAVAASAQAYETDAFMADLWQDATTKAISDEVASVNREIEEAGRRIAAEKKKIEKRVARFREFLRS